MTDRVCDICKYPHIKESYDYCPDCGAKIPKANYSSEDASDGVFEKPRKERQAFITNHIPEAGGKVGNPFKKGDMVLWLNDDSDFGTINRLEHYPDCNNLISMPVEDVCGDMVKLPVLLGQTGWYHHKRLYADKSFELADEPVSITLTGKVKADDDDPECFIIDTGDEDDEYSLWFSMLPESEQAKVRAAIGRGGK